jgi:tyrosine aminotransferase
MGLLGCLMAFTNEGDEILVPELGYPFYQDVCPAMKRVAIPYKLKKESNFEIDLEHLASLVNEKTSFIYIINPTNPMGTVFSRNHMEEIFSFSDKHEIPIVVDEVYFKQVYPGVDYLSFG